MFVRVTSVVPTSRARENYSNQRACRVRFTPNSDRESGFPRKVMSALPSKADVCGANRHVCFGPIADIIPALTKFYARALVIISERKTQKKACPRDKNRINRAGLCCSQSFDD